jgi:16S rRNA (cytidine1402-2'-O)-methyltransferase
MCIRAQAHNSGLSKTHRLFKDFPLLKSSFRLYHAVMKDSEVPTKGRLFLAANSIGCDQDIPQRSLAVARTADLLLFESDKGARRVLKAAGIHRNYLIYAKKNTILALDEARLAFRAHKSVAVWSDQGMPHVEDPGQEILELAWSLGTKIEVIPGPSSLCAAISACPFSMHSFKCFGFAPREEEARRKLLETTRYENAVFFETPYRLKNLLESIGSIMPKRILFLAIEIGNESENYLSGCATEIMKHLPTEKQNFILIARSE